MDGWLFVGIEAGDMGLSGASQPVPFILVANIHFFTVLQTWLAFLAALFRPCLAYRSPPSLLVVWLAWPAVSLQRLTALRRILGLKTFQLAVSDGHP